MTSVGSNVASTSGEPPTCAWVSLTLDEQLANFNRIICKHWPDIPFCDAFFKIVTRVVKKLRIDPFVEIESLLPRTGKDVQILCGTTPLHWAVLMDDRTMVRYILTSRRVGIDEGTWDGESPWGYRSTALHYAIIGGNHDIVEDLLQYKADVCICNKRHETVLHYMVQQKDSMFGILKRILASNVNMRDQLGNTTLHYAAMEGATDVVSYLIDQKGDVNLHNESGFTPLHYAAKEGAFDIVSLLVKHKANIEALNEYCRQTPLLLSTINGRANTSRELIEVGADVHVTDICGNNALHLAIRGHGRGDNMMDIVELLRQRDVDTNAKNSAGYSPFFAAVAGGHTEVVKELLRSKEKIKLMEECNGQTPIQIAWDYGHEHIKRALMECPDVSRYVDDLYRDRQVYVDAANAILVGAALIASVTFASWLQPPLGYTTPYLDLAPSSSDVNYADVQHNVSLRAFWVFNTLSFYFAIGTVVFGARSVLPRRRMFIKTIVVRLHQNLLVTTMLLACSVFFVIIAFGIAGCIVLTPTLKFQLYMIVPTIFGGLVCLVSLGFLFKSMVEDNLEKKRKRLSLYSWVEYVLD